MKTYQSIWLRLSVEKSFDLENRIRNEVAIAIGQVCHIEDASVYGDGSYDYLVTLSPEAHRDAVVKAFEKLDEISNVDIERKNA